MPEICLLGRIKTHSLSGPQVPPQSAEKLPYRAASVFKSFPVIGRGIIAACPPLSKTSSELFAYPLIFSLTDQTSPSPLGGALLLSCVEPCDSHRPEQCRAASDVGEGYCSVLSVSVKRLLNRKMPGEAVQSATDRRLAWRSGACRPVEPCLPDPASVWRASHQRWSRRQGGQHHP